MRFALAAALIACAVPAPRPPPAPPAPPPPLPTLADPGQRLPRTFTPTGYSAHISLSPDKWQFDGTIVIAGTVDTAADVIWLDANALAITGAIASHDRVTQKLDVITTGGDAVAFRPRTPLAPGAWKIAVTYRGRVRNDAEEGLHRTDLDAHIYWSTMFEPIGARRVFPCLDEPDLKVPWQLTLDVPRDVVAASNTAIESETDLDASRKRVVFARTPPLPSYLVAFAAGPYEIVDGGKTGSGVPIRILAFAGHGDSARRVIDQTPRIVTALETWLAMPLPWAKLDLVEVPDIFEWGAMENPGLVAFASWVFRGNDGLASTISSRYWWTQVITHELVHYWFGDLVTMAWWNDLWLNESLAYWLGPEIAAELEPTWQFDAENTASSMEALVFDSHLRVRPTEDDLRHLQRASHVVDQWRGAALLRALDVYIGRDASRRALRAYVAAHAGGNVTTDDLVRELDRVAPHPVDDLVRALIDSTSTPTVAVTATCDHGDVHLGFVRTGELAGTLPVCVAFDRDGKRSDRCVELTGDTLDLPIGHARCPRWILPNAGGRGFYRTTWTAPALAGLLADGWKQLTDSEQLAVACNFLLPVHPYGELELSLLPALASSKDRSVVLVLGDALEYLMRRVTPAERPALDRWIVKALGPRAREIGIAPRDNDDLFAVQSRFQLADLVGRAGDPALVSGAQQLPATGIAVHLERVAARIRAAADPAVAAAALAETRLDTVGAVPNLPELLAGHPHDLEGANAFAVRNLFATSCDPAQRDALAATANQALKPADATAAIAAMDSCLSEQAQLAPALHAWLAAQP